MRTDVLKKLICAAAVAVFLTAGTAWAESWKCGTGTVTCTMVMDGVNDGKILDIEGDGLLFGDQSFEWPAETTADVVWVYIKGGITNVNESYNKFRNENFPKLDLIVIMAPDLNLTSNPFSGLPNLKNFLLPTENNTLSLKDSVLYNKAGNTLISFPAGLERTSFTIPDGVTGIANYAFSGNARLTSITLGGDVIMLSENLFTSVWNLSSINVVAYNTNMSSVDGVLFNYDKNILIAYPYGKSGIGYTVPDGVKVVGARAFQFNPSLAYVTLPASVDSIGRAALYSITTLVSITSLNPEPPSLGQSALPYQPSNPRRCLYVPEDAITAYSEAEQWSTFTCIEPVTGGDVVMSWNCGAPNAEAVTASLGTDGTLTISGSGAIANYVLSGPMTPWYSTTRNSISNVVIEPGVTAIGNNVFYNHANLESVKIPDGVTFIGQNSFQNCTTLTSITLPAGIVTIGTNAFNGCTGLKRVVNMNPAPVDISPTTFDNVDLSEITLYVPEGSEEAYESHAVWGLFGEIKAIEEDDPTSVRHSVAGRVSANNTHVSLRGRTLSVRVPSPSAASYNVRMVDLRGKTVARFRIGENGAGAFSVSKVPAGRYFVEVTSGGKRVSTAPVMVR